MYAVSLTPSSTLVASHSFSVTFYQPDRKNEGTYFTFPDMSKKPCCLTAQVNRVHNDEQIQRETKKLYLSLSLSTKGLSTNPV